VILVCVRWYLACGLSLRNLKEMMAERGISIDHSTIHRWVVHFSPLLQERFNRRERAVGSKWHMDETYIKVRGQWMYLYRAIDSTGETVDFLVQQTFVIFRRLNAFYGRFWSITGDRTALSSTVARPASGAASRIGPEGMLLLTIKASLCKVAYIAKVL